MENSLYEISTGFPRRLSTLTNLSSSSVKEKISAVKIVMVEDSSTSNRTYNFIFKLKGVVLVNDFRDNLI